MTAIDKAEDKAAEAYATYRREKTEENHAAWRAALREWNKLTDAAE